MRTSDRRRKLVVAAAKAGADAVLVTNLSDVRYLCGFNGSNAAFAVKGKESVLFTDGRYTQQAADEVEGSRVEIVQDKSVAVAACAWLASNGAKACAFDDSHMSIAEYKRLQASLPKGIKRAFLLPCGPLVEQLREVKDELEVEQMRAAAELSVKLFHQSLEFIVPGATEWEVAMALEHMARVEGADGMSFETIIAGGERSALPHGRASQAKLPRRGFVVMDFGVVLDGYCSDMTRTVHLGRARTGERETYDAVLAAQEAGLAAMRAGALASEVDAAARTSLERSGLAEYFTHSSGHGVGIEIHESPRLGRKSESRLKAGMIVTMEPGVYLPGRYGIRIEDTVLVTQKGAEILTSCTKAWIEL